MKARHVSDGRGHEVLSSAHVITSLLPHMMASVATMASTDPVAAVKVGLWKYLFFYCWRDLTYMVEKAFTTHE